MVYIANYQGCGGLISEDQLDEYEKSGNYVCEKKCDGIWAELRFLPDKLLILSRNSKVKEYPEFDQFKNLFPVGTILVGELGYGSQESVKERERLGHGFIRLYDVLAFGTTAFCSLSSDIGPETYMFHNHMNDFERRVFLEGLLTDLLTDWQRGYFQLTQRVTSGFKAMYDAEHEGAILKEKPGRPYVGQDKKVKHWIKVKKQPTFDVILLGYNLSTAETKSSEPMAENILVGQYQEVDVSDGLKVEDPQYPVSTYFEKDGKYYSLVPCGHVAGMTHEWCREFAQDFDKWAGKVFEIKAYTQFKSGAFRHPSLIGYRDDKNPPDCVFRYNEEA